MLITHHQMTIPRLLQQSFTLFKTICSLAMSSLQSLICQKCACTDTPEQKALFHVHLDSIFVLHCVSGIDSTPA